MIRGINADIDAWIDWRFHRLPLSSGGWLGTPLALLVKCEAMNVVYDAWRNFRDKSFKREKFTPYERAMMIWLERELAEDITEADNDG